MIEIGDISSEFASLLLNSGWTVDRRVDPTDVVTKLSAEGFSPNAHARKILESLGGLTVRIPAAGLSASASHIRFDPVYAATDEYFRAEHFQSQLAITLFPLGEEVTSGGILWAGSDGKYYLGREFGLYLMGDTFREAMDYMTSPQKIAARVAE